MHSNKILPRRDFLSAGVSAACIAGVAQAGYFSSVPAEDEAKKLGVALVGLGSLSTNQIAPALQKTANCRLSSIVTGTPDKERKWADKYGIDSGSIYNYENFPELWTPEMQTIGAIATISTLVLLAFQPLFLWNFFYSMFRGAPAGNNPWHANTLEWACPSPPPHGNFGDELPTVYRGPYEYSVPGREKDYWPQNEPA